MKLLGKFRRGDERREGMGRETVVKVVVDFMVDFVLYFVVRFVELCCGFSVFN